ncbi:MAG: hypothetical protein WBK51_07985 [Polaromonas sp.]
MFFSGCASTKSGAGSVTYAQKYCCGAVSQRLHAGNRYQSHSASKLLIYIAFLNCFFYGQSSESVDLQGLQPHGGNLSTKLSTEMLNICKASLNQALSAFFACIGQAMPTISHTSRLAT